MKREIANIIKYLIVYGVLLVLPVVIIAICVVVGNRLQGGTMSSDELSIASKAAVLIASILILSLGIYWFNRKYPAREEQNITRPVCKLNTLSWAT